MLGLQPLSGPGARAYTRRHPPVARRCPVVQMQMIISLWPPVRRVSGRSRLPTPAAT